MVMGPTHAMSGAVGWLAAAAVASNAFGVDQSSAELVVGTIACSGAALLPDIDCSGKVTRNKGGSTVARTFGVVSLFVAECVEKACLGLYTITRTKKDGKRRHGHRTFTHTWLFAILIGIGTTALATAYGKPAVIGILFFLTGLAARGLMADWAKKQGWLIVTAISLASSFGMYHLLPADRSYTLLGLAVGIGCFIHTLGDMITKMGCPVVFPIPIAKQVWYDVGVPNRWALRAGGTGEAKVLMPVLTLLVVVGMFWHLPEVQDLMFDTAAE